MQEKFITRHLGIRENDIPEMLKTIGVDSIEQLIDQVIPSHIQLDKDLDLKPAMTEYEFTGHIEHLASKNQALRSLIGMGYYQTASPAVIIRNILQNPAWYTSYTPYQAEISQGRLEALLNYQTMIISLTGLPISNCSLLDDATAAAEAMSMMLASRSKTAVKENRNVLFVDENIFPQIMDLLLTRCEPRGVELAVDNFADYEFSGKEFAAIVQYPGANGEITDYTEFAAKCHANEMQVTAVADLLSLALLESPATWGADIAVGSTQRFGIPMGYGGPSAGYIAATNSYKRNMPGLLFSVFVLMQ